MGIQKNYVTFIPLCQCSWCVLLLEQRACQSKVSRRWNRKSAQHSTCGQPSSLALVQQRKLNTSLGVGHRFGHDSVRKDAPAAKTCLMEVPHKALQKDMLSETAVAFVPVQPPFFTRLVLSNKYARQTTHIRPTHARSTKAQCRSLRMDATQQRTLTRKPREGHNNAARECPWQPGRPSFPRRCTTVHRTNSSTRKMGRA